MKSFLCIPRSSIQNERYADAPLIIISITSYRSSLVVNSPNDLPFASESGSMAGPWNLCLRWSNRFRYRTGTRGHATIYAVKRAGSASRNIDISYAKGVGFDESQQNMSGMISHVSNKKGEKMRRSGNWGLGSREDIQRTY